MKIKYALEYSNRKAVWLAHGIKDSNAELIREAAMAMKGLLKASRRCVLVPVPSHTGKAAGTLLLAQEIGRMAGIRVLDILKGKRRESIYKIKKEGRTPDEKDLKMRTVAKLSNWYSPILIDNVIDTGVTMKAAQEAMKKECIALVLAITKEAKCLCQE